jgi:hypothetical protein
MTERTEQVAPCIELTSGRSSERIRLDAPQKDPDVGDVVAAASRGDGTYVDGVARGVESGAQELLHVRAAQVRRIQSVRPQVIHVLRRGQQLEELDDVSRPAGDIQRQLFEYARGPLAAPI